MTTNIESSEAKRKMSNFPKESIGNSRFGNQFTHLAIIAKTSKITNKSKNYTYTYTVYTYIHCIYTYTVRLFY